MIKNLEKRKDKAMIRSDTDDLWTKIETLRWVLYVIFAIKNERMIMRDSNNIDLFTNGCIISCYGS
jgi:hypothetical protein